MAEAQASFLHAHVEAAQVPVEGRAQQLANTPGAVRVGTAARVDLRLARELRANPLDVVSGGRHAPSIP